MNNSLRRHSWFSPVCWVSSLFTLVLTGCGGQDDIKVYRVPKESSPVLAQAKVPAGHPDISAPASPTPRVTFKKPAGWTESDLGSMRVASFNVKGAGGKQADVSVIPMLGAAGGDVPNVNRWRGQVGLPQTTEDELKKTVQKVEIAGQPAELYELTGKNPASGDPTRVLGVIQHREGTAWFVKMTGDDEVVAAQKPAFLEFLKSLNFAAGDAQAELPPSHPPIDGATLPAGHPDISAASAASATGVSTASPEGQPNWKVPSNWKPIPGGAFLVAKFLAPGEGGAMATVNVSSSGGTGGGLVANVNRWRVQQLGLNELSEAEVDKLATTIDTAGGKAHLFEMSGRDPKTGNAASLVGVIVPQSGQTWFYKLMGDPKAVEAQKEAFTKFVQTAKN